MVAKLSVYVISEFCAGGYTGIHSAGAMWIKPAS